MAGDCYESAGRYVMDDWMFGGDGSPTLVHGRPTLQVDPFCEYGHAWVEFTKQDGAGRPVELVLDTERSVVIPKDLYYQIGRIDPAQCLRYSFQEMRAWIARTGHWGPWE